MEKDFFNLDTDISSLSKTEQLIAKIVLLTIEAAAVVSIVVALSITF
jgi:hypothetical protein